MSAVFNLPKLSTALRDIRPQAEPGCHNRGALQPAAIHKECLLVRGEGAGRSQRCDSKQILATASQELTADLGWHFKPKLDHLLEAATR